MSLKLPTLMGKKEHPQLPAFKSGFLFVPTAGMRLAPELLVQELIREVFFGSQGGATNSSVKTRQDLDPGQLAAANFPSEASAAIHALRGRKRQGGGQPFYAPAYPALAANAWFRTQSDRVIRDFFLGGVLASACGPGGMSAGDLALATVVAIQGDSPGSQRDILGLCADKASGFGTQPDDRATAIQTMVGHLDGKAAAWGLEDSTDPMSVTIAGDWLALCRLEPYMPRFAWIGLVATFLRTALPLWLLAQLRVTSIVRNAFRESLGGGTPSLTMIKTKISERTEGLMIPALTLSNPLDAAVEEYMRARIECSLILHALAGSDEIWKKRLSAGGLAMTVRQEKDVSLEDVLEALKGLGEKEPTVLQDVLRHAESAPAWAVPVKAGQGKNIEEFLRVVRSDHVGESDDAYLLERGPKNKKLFRAFPGHRVLSLYTLLAHAEKSFASGEPTRLILSDLESHFRRLGIDFSLIGGVRAQLLKTLAAQGILIGTPDAGDGVELESPFHHALMSALPKETRA